MPQVSSTYSGNIPPGPILKGGKAAKTRRSKRSKSSRKTNRRGK